MERLDRSPLRVHLYALDIPHVKVQGKLTGPNVKAALDGHVLSKATLTVPIP
jgi:phosphatidylethanolamine-binding protein (PEBP) family uncharacterized protein